MWACHGLTLTLKSTVSSYTSSNHTSVVTIHRCEIACVTAVLPADPPLPVSQYSDVTFRFEQSSGSSEYRATLNVATGEELRFSVAVRCYPTPAVFDWPSEFNVLNTNEPKDDVTVFDLSVSVTEEVVYSFTGRNGFGGQAVSAFSFTGISETDCLFSVA